jgi:hypothetical protein
MADAKNMWDGAAMRQQYRRELERGETAFRQMFGSELPTHPNRQAFHDLCLAELDLRRHLLEADAFSSREALLAEMRRLLAEPFSASSPVCSSELYLNCQKKEIESEICKL